MADELAYSAVYMSWVTFKNAIESLGQGIPNQIDRSTFPGLSGGVQSQLLAGLKFLGLTDENGKPTDELQALANLDEAKRKEVLKRILQTRYSALFALDLMKTTPNQLGECMASEYNVSGDTREKAVRFFLSAVTYVGIQVSRLFDKQLGNSNGTTRVKRRIGTRSKAASNEEEEEEEEEAPKAHGTSRSVKLKSGGALTVSATLDFFQLTPDDRQFVFGLIDQLDKYERENAQKDGSDLV